MTKCPKCDSDNVTRFEKDVYILNNIDIVRKPLYGCNACKSLFVIAVGEKLLKAPETSIEKAQSTCSKISKQCFKMLENFQ